METRRIARTRLEFHETPGFTSVSRIGCASVPRPTGEHSPQRTFFRLSSHTTQDCWICGTFVSPDSCQVDEHGKAVHEQCYAARLALERASAEWVLQNPDKIDAARAGH
jgi:hypothetical protein